MVSVRQVRQGVVRTARISSVLTHDFVKSECILESTYNFGTSRFFFPVAL